MVKISVLFRTYIWLLDTIMRAGRITLEQVNQRWVRTELSGGVEMHRNTFKRHLTSIEEMFDITIVCDTSTYEYHLEDRHAMRQNSMQRWMLNTMTVAGVVAESRSLHDRILLENVPSGDHHLVTITRAMQMNCILTVQYQKFVDSEPYVCQLEPYCLKLFHQRWYLLAHRTDRTYLAVYALDRMLDVRETESTFTLPRGFDAEQHFEDMFGVYQPAKGERPVRVVLRTYDGEWNYLRTLPLHGSQQEVRHKRDGSQELLHKRDAQNGSQELLHKGDDQYIDFTYRLYPTLDFLLELLSHGNHIEVLEPADLRQQIQTMLLHAGERYAGATNRPPKQTP